MVGDFMIWVSLLLYIISSIPLISIWGHVSFDTAVAAEMDL
jgi:hypothetical protein